VTAEATTVLFADEAPLPGGPGYLSDHLGLSARLRLMTPERPPPTAERPGR
jgi:hypothetical protein